MVAVLTHDGAAASAAGEQVYGPESSGKTTVALHAVAQCQKAGEPAGHAVSRSHPWKQNSS